MATQKGKVFINNLAKGLNTEASPLAFPDNCTTEDINCDITRTGSHRRRFGLDYEFDHKKILSYIPTPLEDVVTTSYTWRNVNEIGGLDFIVVQINNILYFFEDTGTKTLSENQKRYALEIEQYRIDPSIPVAKMHYATGKGALFVCQRNTTPIMLSYDKEQDLLEVQPVTIQERDLQGLNDGLGTETYSGKPQGIYVVAGDGLTGSVVSDWSVQPEELSPEHHYNLLNQGWTLNQTPDDKELIDKYHTSQSKYPANSQQWWVGKTTDEKDFDAAVTANFDFGNRPAPKGRIILNAFNKQRSKHVTGLDTKFDEVFAERPSDIAFFASRLWYLVGNKVYFSQTLSTSDAAGRCYQEGDPTSEDSFDLVETDGGVILLNGMERGLSIHSATNTLIVIASNGVWTLTGATSDEGFSVTSHAVRQLTSLSCLNEDAIVDVEGTPFFIAQEGIFTFAKEEFGAFKVVNLSQDTIQTLFANISLKNKKRMQGGYSSATGKVFWYYPEQDNSIIPDTFLVYDIKLQAFNMYKISTKEGFPILGSVINLPEIQQNVIPTKIVNSYGQVVGDSQGDFLTVSYNLYTKDLTNTKFLCYNKDKDSEDDVINWFSFAEFNNRNYLDWENEDGKGLDFVSTFTSGYSTLQDTDSVKNIIQMQMYLRRSESSFNNYSIENPSSITYQIKWDWEDSNASNMWGKPYQGYLNNRLRIKNAESEVLGQPVIHTKHKVLGRGKSFQIKFSSEKGKDFDILGWGLEFKGTT